jgi:hypothetical protein
MKKLIIFLAFIAALLTVFLIFFTTNKKLTTPIGTTQDNQWTLEGQEELPVLVQEKRQAIYNAAMEKNYDAIANEALPTIRYSFGVNEPGKFAEYMKQSENTEKKSAFEIIPILLSLPYTKQDDMYVWPSVFGKEAKNWNDDDMAMMKMLLTDEQIEGYRSFGSYAYYRLGINETGEWVYYLAGD